MTISISVVAGAAAGPLPVLGGPSVIGAAAHIVSNHPLNHLLHPDSAPGAYGVLADVDLGGLFASVPGPLGSVAHLVDSPAPAFLHLAFNDTPIVPGISLSGTEIDLPRLGIGQMFSSQLDSTMVVLHNVLGK